jgi:hypothetical protein
MLRYIATLEPAASGASAASKGSGSGRTQSLDAVQAWKFAWEDVRVQRRLGVGSFGQVFLATLHETPIALKVLMDARAIAAQSSGPDSLSATASVAVATASEGALVEEVAIMAALR